MKQQIRTYRLQARATGSAGRKPVRLRRGSATWQVEEDWQDRLLGPDAPDWLALDTDDRAQCVKKGHLRAIWRVTLAGSAVFAKVYESGRIRDRVKRLLTGDPAQREWRKAREAAARGVPAIRPLAVGIHHTAPRRSVYLSEGIHGAVSLADAWERVSVSQDAARLGHRFLTGETRAAHRQLSGAVARLFAGAHGRGFFHPDSHPGNILVRAASDGVAEAFFVDAYPVRLTSGAVSMRRAITALAQLDHYFRRHATRAQRLRFLRVYLAARHELDLQRPARRSTREWATAIAANSARYGKRLARQRDRRLRRDGKYYSTLRLSGGWVATVVLELERRHAFPEKDVLDRSREDWVDILRTLPTLVWEGDSAEGLLDGSRLCLTWSRLGHLPSRAFCTLTRSPDRRVFERSHARRHRDLPGELILGYLEHRTAGLIDATALIRPVRKVGRENESGG